MRVVTRGEVVANRLEGLAKRTSDKQVFTGQAVPVEIPVAEVQQVASMIRDYGAALQIQARIIAGHEAKEAGLEQAIAAALGLKGALDGASLWRLVRFWLGRRGKA